MPYGTPQGTRENDDYEKAASVALEERPRQSYRNFGEGSQMAKARATGDAARASLRKSLSGLATRLQNSRQLRRGNIVLRLGGAEGGEFRLECTDGGVRINEGLVADTEAAPLLEVFGDSNTIRAIIDGEKDAVRQFYAGGIRIRGDLRYFSDVAVELGILKEPL